MAVVRKAQIAALQQSSEKAYLESAADHLESYHPPLAAEAGRSALKQAAQRALNASRSYSLSAGGGVQLYLELMADFGSSFDADPAYRWLHPFLSPMAGVSDAERTRLLHFHAAAYLTRAHGPQNEFARSAVDRTLERLPRIAQMDTLDASRAAALLTWLHPEREPFLEADTAGILLSEAQAAAKGGAAALLLVLKYHLGSGVLSDPLFPWVANALHAGTQPLLNASITHFESVRNLL